MIIDSCFVVTTPFQIITAINLTLHHKTETDLFIVPQFKNAEDVAKRIAETNVFRRVIYVNTDSIEKYKKNKSRLLRHLGIARNYLGIETVISSFYPKDIRYSNIYISSKANIGRLMVLYYLKMNYDFKVICFDDGEASYDNIDIIRPTKLDRILQRLCFKRTVYEKAEDLLLYSPDLFFKLNKSSSFHISAIPPIRTDEEFRGLMNFIFGFSESDSIKERVIILDILKEGNLLDGEEKKLLDAYEMICSHYGENDVIIKRHPRDKGEEKPIYRYFKNYSIPFEVVLMNMDLNKTVIVSVGTTALVLPKLLFGVQPRVLYLGKMIKTKQNTKIGHSYYEACKALYDCADLFFMPESIDELSDYLKEN